MGNTIRPKAVSKTAPFLCSFQIKNSILSLPRNFEPQAVEYHLRSTRYYKKPDLNRTSFSNSYFSKILNGGGVY